MLSFVLLIALCDRRLYKLLEEPICIYEQVYSCSRIFEVGSDIE